jgi:hypothetical protein
MAFNLLHRTGKKRTAALLMLFLLGNLFLLPSVFPQVDRLKKLKDIKTTTEDIRNIRNLNDATGFLKERLVEYLKKHKDEFDKTDLNYAISYSENSGMYETEEKFGRMQKTLLYVLDRSMENRSERTQAAITMMAGTGLCHRRFEWPKNVLASNKLRVGGIYNAIPLFHGLGNSDYLYMNMGKYTWLKNTLCRPGTSQKQPDDAKGWPPR